VPAAAPVPGEKPAWDVEAGPQVAEAAEAMELTGRIDLVGQGAVTGTSPVELKPMNREQVARMRESRAPIAPPVMQPVVHSAQVTTGPIAPPAPPQGAEAIHELPQKDGIRRGDLKDNLPHLLGAYYQAKETGELGLMKGQVKKIIYFESGMPVFALSNLVADRLGQFLVRAGKI